jgi:predicted choloylglycine hydrolase
MGFNYGTILHKNGFKLPHQPNEKLTFAKKCEPEVKRIFPEALEEIHGFADASHTPYDDLAALILGVGAFSPPNACSIFAVATSSETLFGRNYDFYYRFKEHTESYFTRPSDGYSSVGNTDIFVGREDGVNEKGLAIGMTAVRPVEVTAGISFALLVRCILDKCATVREAAKVLTSAGHLTANNYLVADRQGDIVVVEACPDRVMVRHPEQENRFLVCTNHFIHNEMIGMEDKKERPPDSTLRHSTISGRLSRFKNPVKARDAQRILSDHKGRVCSHVDEIKLGTLWSLVARLNKPSIYIAEGHPCRTKYKLDTRLNKHAPRRRRL